MIRDGLVKKGVGVKAGFRWRGSGEIARIEGFSDAVFAFAITLLVVSLEVPRTFTELMGSMRGFIAFAIGFVMLFQIWYAQYVFFRRYGLQDTTTLVLNGALLFVVLFYVYPLKFLFTYLVNALSGASLQVELANGHVERMVGDGEAGKLMVIYGIGYCAVFGVFLLLYVHALRQASALELTELERFDTKQSILENTYNILIGLASLAVVLIGGSRLAAWSGMTYVLIGPVMGISGAIMGKRRRRLADTAAVESHAG
ncbi:MAG: TMEM175 family protein [Thermoanaerobaculia bacterium]